MLYANDLSLGVNDDVTIIQYADDTQVLVSGNRRDLHRIVARMQIALNYIYTWFCHNGMKLNTAKTQMLVLGTPAMLRDLPPVSINFCGTVIKDAGSVKNLGLTMDRHLNFQNHIDTITHKCTGLLVALSHTRHVIPKAALKTIVEALVISILRYCMSLYGSCGVTQKHRVQKMINFCARVVTGKRRYDHISDAVRQLRWPTATDMIDYHTVCAIERILVSGQPHYLKETIGDQANQVHQHNTRRAGQRTLPRIRTEAGRRRLCFRGVSLLNRTGLVPGSPQFKAQLKEMLPGISSQ